MDFDVAQIIPGVTLTPPAIGRIMMGHTEIRQSGKDRKILPAKDDHFTVTTLVQLPDRRWEPHPMEADLKKGKEKLLAIPVRLAFHDPKLSLHNAYACFDAEKGRVLCTGRGETAMRATREGVTEVPCPRPERCTFGRDMRCRNMTRFYVQIEGQQDELGLFVLRSTSFNSLDRLAGRLNQWSGLTGGRIAGLPLQLTLNAKTAIQSCRTPFYFADLVQRRGMSLAETVKAAREFQEARESAGLNQEGLETAMRVGLANSDFADEIEDAEEWMSDADLAAGAEKGLEARGLRGLDALVAAAKGQPPAEGESDGPGALPKAA
jgi:hypothetical protein